jgi:choline kinase
VQAVILAAGDGGRLRPLTDDLPKPLIHVGGRPILARVLESLHAVGVRDAVVVAGYRSGALRKAAPLAQPADMRVRFVVNGYWERGNARSLWEARRAVDGPFLLTMADHLIEPAIFRALAATHDAGRCRLAVDHCDMADSRSGEATLALVRGSRVVDLGKSLETWNALDTGAFWCTGSVFDALTPELRDGELGEIFGGLARAGALDAVDVTGQHWIDIDTPRDLQRAESMLGVESRMRSQAASGDVA